MKNHILVKNVNYRITEFAEEKVPLSSGAGCPYYGFTITALIVAVCILLIGGYIVWCSKYRKRVSELNGDCTGIAGWNVWKLQRKISELEMQRTEELMTEMIFE